MPDKFACDTSVIFNGQILKLLEDNELGESPEIYISNIVIAEVEYRTNIQKEIGFFGLNVLKQLRQLHDEGEIKLHVVGNFEKCRFKRVGIENRLFKKRM